MKIIKRSGSEDIFDAAKIVAAIRKANDSVLDYEKLTADQIEEIASNVETACENMKRSPSVEEIQDMVENQLMNKRAFTVARNYITYRYKRAIVRKSNSTDQQILSLLECNNEEVKQENMEDRCMSLLARRLQNGALMQWATNTATLAALLVQHIQRWVKSYVR